MATHVKCDRCNVEAPPASGVTQVIPPPPEGWQVVETIIRGQRKRYDLCGDCAAALGEFLGVEATPERARSFLTGEMSEL